MDIGIGIRNGLKLILEMGVKIDNGLELVACENGRKGEC